ncbi:hypothetical protein SOVF_174920 [Spinacia oleracea]|nr:hypothetical protein SOVF_174920 [Spinacia oleracea]
MRYLQQAQPHYKTRLNPANGRRNKLLKDEQTSYAPTHCMSSSFKGDTTPYYFMF